MKANEFVKKIGWDEARYFLGTTVNFGLFCEPKLNLVIHQSITEPTHSGFDFVFHRDDLKRLVYSYELVEKLGGLEKCKMLIAEYGNSESAAHLSYHVENVESCHVD